MERKIVVATGRTDSPSVDLCCTTIFAILTLGDVDASINRIIISYVDRTKEELCMDMFVIYALLFC